MELKKLKLPSISNNFIVWIVVIFIILGFGTSSSTLGGGFLNIAADRVKDNHKSSHGRENKGGLMPAAGLGKAGGFLGGNGLFILAIVALLFLCKDEKKEEHIDDIPVVEYNQEED